MDDFFLELLLDLEDFFLELLLDFFFLELFLEEKVFFFDDFDPSGFNVLDSFDFLEDLPLADLLLFRDGRGEDEGEGVTSSSLSPNKLK